MADHSNNRGDETKNSDYTANNNPAENSAAERFTIIDRLALFFMGIFSPGNRTDIKKAFTLKKKLKRLAREYESYVAVYEKKFYPSFGREISELSSYIEPLRGYFKPAEEDFFGFLNLCVETVAPELHQKVETLADPEIFKKKMNIDFAKVEVMGDLFKNKFDEFVSEQNYELNLAINEFAQEFAIVKLLSHFDFEAFVDYFKNSQGEIAEMAHFHEVKKSLVLLREILAAIKSSHGDKLQRIIFQFYAEQAMLVGEEPQGSLGEYVTATRLAVQALIKFRDKFQIDDFVRIINQSLEIKPVLDIKGISWQREYKKHWSERFVREYQKYQIDETKKKTMAGIRDLFKSNSFETLNFYNNNIWRAEHAWVRYEVSAALCVSFFQDYFNSSVGEVCKIVLIEGRFYNARNAKEYNNAVHGLLAVEKDVDSFREALQSDGQIGHRLASIARENPSPVRRARELKAVLSDVDEQIKKKLDDFRKWLNRLINLNNGVLRGQTGSEYGGLENYRSIQSHKNQEFIERLTRADDFCVDFHKLFLKVYDFESSLEI